jgi:hypothetical protein
MGGEFPRNASIQLSVITHAMMRGVFSMPYRIEGHIGFTRTLFSFFGLQFTLWLGNQVPGEARRTALFPAEGYWIGISPAFDQMLLRHAVQQMSRAREKGSQ